MKISPTQNVVETMLVCSGDVPIMIGAGAGAGVDFGVAVDFGVTVGVAVAVGFGVAVGVTVGFAVAAGVTVRVGVGVLVPLWWFLLGDDEPEDEDEWPLDAKAYEAVVPTTIHRAAVAAMTPPTSLRRAGVLRGEDFSARRKSCCMKFFCLSNDRNAPITNPSTEPTTRIYDGLTVTHARDEARKNTPSFKAALGS
ncbi:hypothetical protein [Cryobacterium sp. GrIS_2_6]|uniref:hypothetical protein n=1 Tax=Cryobacterium sp. GrIS_2_6 TaxID=3162785 RepID=UPI002E0AB007|nr:hypothetical protein [Cryobacterium psychrotolerans]